MDSQYSIKELIALFKHFKFVRAVSRQTGLSRTKIKKILLQNNVAILSNDDANRLSSLKHARNPFTGSSKEKAWLYGFVLGDVHVFKKSKFTLRAITHTTHKSFVNLFQKAFQKYGVVNCRFNKKQKRWALWIDLEYRDFSFLEQRTESSIPSWIDDSNFIEFIAGFIDSDGSVLIRKTGNYFQYLVKLFGQEHDLLLEIQQRLRAISIKSNICRVFKSGSSRSWRGKIIQYNKDYFELVICRKEEVINLLRLLPIKHKEKTRKRDQMLDIYARGPFLWDDIKEEIIELRQSIQTEVRSHLAEQLP